MLQQSIEHLKMSKKGYWEHFGFAIYWGVYLIYLGITSIIHAIVPAWFKFTSANGVIHIVKMLKKKDSDLYNLHTLD